MIVLEMGRAVFMDIGQKLIKFSSLTFFSISALSVAIYKFFLPTVLAHTSATRKTNSLPKIFTKGFPLYLEDPNLAGIIIIVLLFIKNYYIFFIISLNILFL